VSPARQRATTIEDAVTHVPGSVVYTGALGRRQGFWGGAYPLWPKQATTIDAMRSAAVMSVRNRAYCGCMHELVDLGHSVTHAVVGLCREETITSEHLGISPAEDGWTVANDNEMYLVAALTCNVLQH
jgi:hypothetical protein